MAKSLGVPYVLLKSGNNANIDANQKLFYQHTVVPILNQFCSAFSLYFNNAVEITPNKLEVVPDPKTFISHYDYMVADQQGTDFFGYNKETRRNTNIRFEANEIIQVMNENTSSIFRGTSKLKPLIRLIELYYYMINFQRQFFKNNALQN